MQHRLCYKLVDSQDKSEGGGEPKSVGKLIGNKASDFE
jgi:hypothetical protein